MKIVKEHINEKFEQESDPIKDMGIGMEKEIEKFKEFVNTDRNVIINLNDDNNLLCWAAYYNKFDIVTYMINQGADINYRSVRALHFAACADNIELGVYLVKCGADLNLAVKESKELSKETIVGMKKIQDVLRKKVDEKFTGESDPITDLGIGMYQIYKNLKQGDLVRFKKRLDIENSEPPRFYSKGGIIEIDQVTYKKNDDIIIQYRYYPDKTFLRNNSPSRSDIWGWNFDFFKEYFEPFNRKQIYEKFSDTDDPIKDMGIGFVNKIFNLSQEFYSYVSRYYSEKEWKKIIAWMLKEYEPWEVLACLDNKMMRYAYQENADKKHATLKDFQKYNSKYEIEREETEMDRILGNYRIQHTKWIDEYKDMAKEAGIYTESVYEKFSEHSDPVKDLRIGAIEVFYYFYISEWAENVLIDFNNPNDVKLLDWLKFNKAVNSWDSKQRYEFNKLARKAGLERKYESDGKLHHPLFSKQGGPDIMLRVSETNDPDHLFDNRIYQEWVWNWNDISSDPGPKYKLLKDINRRYVKESLYEKFSDESDPIKDLEIGHNAQMVKLNATINWDLNMEDFPEYYEDQIIDIITYKKYEFETKSHSFNQKPLHIKVSRLIKHSFSNKYTEKIIYFATSDVGESYDGKELHGASTAQSALNKEKKWLQEYFDSL